MIDTEERSERIATTDGLTVDGVLRVSRVSLQLRAFRIRFERQDPRAIVVQRRGHSERMALRDGSATAPPLVWLAMPLAAGIVARMMRSPRKKGA